MTAPKQRTSTEGPVGLEGYSVDDLYFIWQRLDDSQREYVTMYYHRARKLSKLATDAWNKRASRLQYLLDYCEVNNYNDFQTRQKVITDWVFTDANDDWLRFSREVRRCQVAMDTELKMGLLKLGSEVPSAG